ncbi:MAG TPA: sugar phosphate nucleotidyltransferase, partial [Thermoanaerobaculia bacterium]|nr:sugar phosphate nucleotidyltransferase [Thermoanaerobaculia bacterium]
MNRAAVILAGGAGTRLWPLSTEQRPKQFLEIFHGESLLQKTWKRLSAIFPGDRIFVSTQEAYRSLCHQQLPELREENVIAEP